jgi:hypothetical protein
VLSSPRNCCVAPFAIGSVTDRAYFIVRPAATAGRREVDDFVDWLIVEGAAVAAREPVVPGAKRRQRASRKK